MNARIAIVTIALLGGATLGCEPAKEPNVPGGSPGAMGPDNPMMPPQPGGPQIGAVDEVPEGAPRMNAQAATLYMQGMAAWAQGNLQGAKQAFRQATEADPKAFQAHYSLGAIQERLGESGAGTSYAKAYEIVPEYDRAIVAHGLFLAKTGKEAKADELLTKKRSKLPKSAPLAAGLAEVKSLQGDTAGAQELAREALKLDPKHAPAMMTIARDHYRNRRLDLSLYALKAIVDGTGPDNPPRDPNNAEAHLLKATILDEQDLRAPAMEEYKKALGLRPDLTVARLKVATFMLESGDAQQALPMLQKVLQYEPDNVSAHLSLGDAYRLTDQYKLAEKEFKWVKQKDSSLAAVHYNLGLLYLFAPEIPGMKEKAKILAAIDAFEQFKELKPKAEGSDVDELLKQANLKKAEIEALESVNNPPPPPPPAPADGGGDGGGG